MHVIRSNREYRVPSSERILPAGSREAIYANRGRSSVPPRAISRRQSRLSSRRDGMGSQSSMRALYALEYTRVDLVSNVWGSAPPNKIYQYLTCERFFSRREPQKFTFAFTHTCMCGRVCPHKIARE